MGDFVIVDSFMGSVEHIGIKSTRLRSLTGEQIVMANADLLKSRLRNYGRMTERRVLFTIGVTYDTPAEKLERIPGNHPQHHSGAGGHAVRPQPFRQSWRVLAGLRDGVLRPLGRLQPPHGHPTGDPAAASTGSSTHLGVEFAYPTQRLILERAAAPARESSSAPAATLAGAGF